LSAQEVKGEKEAVIASLEGMLKEKTVKLRALEDKAMK